MEIGNFEDFKNSLTVSSLPFFTRNEKNGNSNLSMRIMKGLLSENSLDQILENIEETHYNENISIYNNILLKCAELAQKSLRGVGNSILIYKGFIFIYFFKPKTYDIPFAIYNEEVYTCGDVNSVFVKIKIPKNIIIEDFIQEFCKMFSDNDRFKYFYI